MTGPRAPDQGDHASWCQGFRDALSLAEGLAVICWAFVIVSLIVLVLSSLAPSLAVMTVDMLRGRP